MVPTHWSMLTISDNNLCALLDVTKSADAAKTLLSQLAMKLGSIVEKSVSLDEILVGSNAGLPVGMFEEYTRSRKAKCSSAHTNEDAGGSGERGNDADSPRKNFRDVSSSAGHNSTPEEVLQVLSKSPHIIMCCPNKGSISYILTVPTMDSSQKLSFPRIQAAEGRGLPGNAHGAVGSVLDAEAAEMGKRKSSIRAKVSRKGKEKAVDDDSDVLDGLLQNAISGLVRTSLHDSLTGCSSSEEPRNHFKTITPVPTPPNSNSKPTSTPAFTSHDNDAMSHDYDPEKFSKFADFLQKMDPIDSFLTFPDDDPVTCRSSRTGSFKSTESDSNSMDDFRRSSMTNLSVPGINAESPLAVQQNDDDQQIHAHENSADLTIPDVPMSWLFPGNTELHDDEGMLSRELTSVEQDIRLTTPTCGKPGQSSEMDDGLMDASGVNFNLDMDSESWQQLLQCSLQSPNGEHLQIPSNFSNGSFPHVDQLLGSSTPSDLAETLLSDPGTILNAGTSASNPHVVVTTAGSNSWNGTWQNCNPNSIKNWLQSSFPMGECLLIIKEVGD